MNRHHTWAKFSVIERQHTHIIITLRPTIPSITRRLIYFCQVNLENNVCCGKKQHWTEAKNSNLTKIFFCYCHNTNMFTETHATMENTICLQNSVPHTQVHNVSNSLSSGNAKTLKHCTNICQVRYGSLLFYKEICLWTLFWLILSDTKLGIYHIIEHFLLL